MSPNVQKRNQQDRWIVRSVLLVGLLLTGLLLVGTHEKLTSEDASAFMSESRHITDILREELEATDEALHQVSGLFKVTSAELDSDSFRLIAETTLAQQRSIQYISFARWVPADQKQIFEDKNWRASGVAQFRIHNQNQTWANPEFYLPVVYLEPLSPKSISYLGYDLWAESKLRIKILEAIDSGRTVTSEALRAQFNGFGFLRPIYSGKFLPSTLEQRRKSVYGLLWATVDTQAMMSHFQGNNNLRIALFTEDQELVAAKDLKLQKNSPWDEFLTETRELKLGDVNYSLRIEKLIPFTSAKALPYLMVFLLGASVSSLVAYRLSHFLRSQREIHERQAEIEAKVGEKTKALKQSEELLRQVINSNPNIIFAQTADFRILFANQKFFETFQRSPDEVYGEKINFELPGQRSTLMASSEEQIQLPDGSFKWFETTRVGIDLENRLPCYLIVSVDISQKKVAEALIAEQQVKMVSSAKLSALGEMAGGVAHEINTPLTTILLLSEQITKILKTAEPNLAIIGHHAQVITRTTGRIAKIVSGLRTFSRDGGDDRMLSFSLKNTIEEALSLCREKFQNSGVRLEFDFPEDFEIIGREVQIAQVFLNLLNNSFDAVQGVKNPWIRIRVSKTESMIQVTVEDNGVGVSEVAKEKMFQPFFTTKEIGKGTGLGLSISKGIIESHHGRLYCEENSGHTKFVVEVPLKLSTVFQSTNQLLS